MYFLLKDKTISGKLNMSEQEIKKEKYKEKRLSGFLLDDDDSLIAMEPSGEGNFTPIKVKNDAIIKNKLSIYSIEQYKKISEYLNQLILQMGELLHDGNISVDPLDGKKAACEYCDYADICRHVGEGKNIVKLGDSEAVKMFDEEGESNE